ncbi:MAG: DEAD/DEAH box helicase [Lentisphaerae bacterium]|nr:DEAD/DEAH box helicase [Lentisphaerota bacterium]
MTAAESLDFNNLKPFDQAVFLVMFLCMRSVPRHLVRILRESGVKAEGSGRAVREGDVDGAITRLLQARLIQQSKSGGLVCMPLPLGVQRSLFSRPEIRGYLTSIERALSDRHDVYGLGCLVFESRGRFKPISLVHQALLEERIDDIRFMLVDNEISSMYDWDAYAELMMPVLLRELASLAPRAGLYLFPEMSTWTLVACEPAAPLTGMVTSPGVLGRSMLLSPSVFLPLCVWHTWTGGREALRQLAAVAKGKGNETIAAEACAALLDGDAVIADKLFALFGNIIDYDRQIALHSVSSFLMLAALAAIRANKSKTRVRNLIASSGRLPARYAACAFSEHLGMLDDVANRGGGAVVAEPADTAAHQRSMDTFICALAALFLHDGAVDKQLGRQSLQLLRSAHTAGYRWMAVSLAPGVRRLLPNHPEAAELCRQVEASTSTVPLWSQGTIVQPWEQALKEIGSLLPATGAASASDGVKAGSVLIQWLLVLDDADPDDVRVRRLSVRACKMLKSGKWSSGRHIDLYALVAGTHDALLGPRDLEVKNALKQGYGTRHAYHGDVWEAYWILPALADHPQVYRVLGDGNRHISYYDTLPIRIVKGDPAIEIAATRGGRSTELRLPWRESAAYAELQLVRERDDVFTVFEKGPLHHKLAAIVGRYGKKNRLVIPAEGSGVLQGLLAPLAKVIGVKGEFDAEAVDARLVEGGVQFRLRARFVNGVLHLDLVNQPVPDLPLVVPPGSGTRKMLARLAGETVAVSRDLDGERAARDAFTAGCPSLAAWEAAPHHWEVAELPAILEVLDEVHGLSEAVVLEWPEGRALEVVRPGSGAPFALKGTAGADYWLEIGGDVALDDGKVMAFTDLLAGLGGRTDRFVPLSEGRYLCLTRHLMRQIELLAQAGEVSRQKLRLPPAALPMLDTMVASDAREGLDFPARIRDRIADFRKAFRHKPPLPASLTCELRPYQQEGFVWLFRLAACGLGACLADDMGLGKTIQILALLTARADDGPALVIAPTSVSSNWADEAARFAPALRVTLLAEVQDRAACVRGAQPFDVVVCSYGLLTFEEDLLTSRPWGAVVLDEAQAVKNRQAKRTRIVKRLDTRLRAVATGTPVENNLGELWSLFDFLNPGLLGTHGRFEQRFCNADGTVSPLLKRMTAPFILRRLKSEVLDDLPPKTEITLAVTLDDDERSLYESGRREALASLDAREDEANRITILAHLTKLRRACCHPSLLLPGSPLPGQKVETFLELVGDLRANGHRALVFSQFVDFLGIIRQRLDAAGFTYQYLDGSTPLGQRAEAVSRFQRGEGDLFLISLKAGGTGLNLTAASFVILLDPWWNPAVEMQAADRAHRIGQRQPVTIYRLVTTDTVEERVVELHARKRAMAEDLLEGTGDTRLSSADLVALFRAGADEP